MGKRLWNGKQACLTLSFDCDLEEDYRALPLLLRALDNHKIRASFACIGKWIESRVDDHLGIVNAGHEILNHTYTHPSSIYFHPDERFNELTCAGRDAEIEQADSVISSILGYKAVGFRVPHFGSAFTVDIYSSLQRLCYKYSSSTVAIRTPEHGNPFIAADRVWEFPLTMDPSNILWCFDTWSRFKKEQMSNKKATEKRFFNDLKWMVQNVVSNNSYGNLYFDPVDIDLLKGFDDFLRFLDNFRSVLWIAPYAEIVQQLEKQGVQRE